MRRVWLLWTPALALLIVCSCHGDQRSTPEQGLSAGGSDLGGVDVNSREEQASERIMDLLVKRSIAVPTMVKASFSSNGKVLRCKVKFHTSGRTPLIAEREALVREICAVIEELGRLGPPPSLSFQVSFSVPLSLPSESPLRSPPALPTDSLLPLG